MKKVPSFILIIAILLFTTFPAALAADGRPLTTDPVTGNQGLIRGTVSAKNIVSEGQSIQSAIDGAKPGETIVVRPGTYEEHIVLADGVSLVSQVPGRAVIDAQGKGPAVTGIGIGSATILSGFVITGGDNYLGGGVHLENSSLTLLECVISNNKASLGGGLYVHKGAPSIVKCTFESNNSFKGSGAYLNHAAVTMGQCIYRNNTARQQGGAIDNHHSKTLVKDSLVYGNTSLKGGAFFNENQAKLELLQCTIVKNSSKMSGGVYNSASSVLADSCIFWENGKNEIKNFNKASLSIKYSNLTGLKDANGNTGNDPGFVDANAGDFHLKKNSPCIDSGSEELSRRVQELDLDGKGRVTDGNGDRLARTDMGAYEAGVLQVTAEPGYTVEGSEAVVTGRINSIYPRDSYTMTVDWGDGKREKIEFAEGTRRYQVGHVYSDDQSKGAGTKEFPVQISVVNQHESTASATTRVTVDNEAPSVRIPNAGIYTGQEYVATADVTDPGSDVWRASVNYGDGREDQVVQVGPDKKISLLHTYAKVGEYTVSLEVRDDDGGVSVANARVYVTEVLAAPVVTTEPVTTPPAVVLSNNADLSGLAVSSGTLNPAFHPSITSYTVNVPHTVTSAAITAICAEGHAVIRINGNATPRGSESVPVVLSVGTNDIPVVVTAQDGVTVKGYTVHMVRAPAPSVPNLVSAKKTNGTVITLTFDQPMADPSGHEAQFHVSSTAYSRLTLTRHADNHSKIDVSLFAMNSRVPISLPLNISYTAGTFASESGTALESIPGFAVTATEIPVILSAETNADGTVIIVEFDRPMDILSEQELSFRAWINETANNVTSVTANSNPSKMNLVLTSPISAGHPVSLNVHGSVRSLNEEYGSIFGDYAVTNNVTLP